MAHILPLIFISFCILTSAQETSEPGLTVDIIAEQQDATTADQDVTTTVDTHQHQADKVVKSRQITGDEQTTTTTTTAAINLNETITNSTTDSNSTIITTTLDLQESTTTGTADNHHHHHHHHHHE